MNTYIDLYNIQLTEFNRLVDMKAYLKKMHDASIPVQHWIDYAQSQIDLTCKRMDYFLTLACPAHKFILLDKEDRMKIKRTIKKGKVSASLSDNITCDKIKELILLGWQINSTNQPTSEHQ